jgi:hypothetical protein
MSTLTPESTQDLLQRLSSSPAAMDETSRRHVLQALEGQPDVQCALVQRTLGLEHDLAEARQQIARLKRMHPAPARPGPTAEDLKRQSDAWGRLLGTSAKRRAPATAEAGGAPPARRSKTFEDVGARFFADHAGKVWLGLGVLTAVVVAVREKLI